MTDDTNVLDRAWHHVKALGPALVLSALLVGPGSIALSTVAGSSYGYRLLWVPVVATIFMITYTVMAARLGLVTDATFFTVVRSKYGATVANVGGVFGFVTILAFQAGNSVGIGFAANALFGYDVSIWATVFTVAAAGFLWLPELYDKIELLVEVVVVIMILSFVGTLIIVGVDVPRATAGLVPSFPDRSSIFLSLGITATNFSIAGAIYQVYLMNEKEWGIDQLREEGIDSVLGIALLGVIIMAILLTSAGAFAGDPTSVSTAQGMAEQLRPLAGPAAFYLFTVGFFFATLSTLVVNPLVGATLLADAFGRDASMDGRPVKVPATLAMAVGLSVVLAFDGSPVELIGIAQAVAIVGFPLLGFLLLSVTMDSAVMGEHENGPVVIVLGALGYLVILAIVLNYLTDIIGVF